MKKQILVVDDEPNVRLSYRITLETEGFIVLEADSGAKALEQFATNHFDLAILDMRMPEMDGLELLATVRQRELTTPTVIITAYGEIPHAVRAMQLGAIDFLKKPLTPEALRNVVSEVFARHISPASRATRTAPVDSFTRELSEAKRLLNLQEFETAWEHLAQALELKPHSPDVLNLAGVFFEMQEDYERAEKLYQKAINCGQSYEPAEQNLRRLMELVEFGTSKESVNLGAE
jgi:DNA-binding response OmpR family regulator